MDFVSFVDEFYLFDLTRALIFAQIKLLTCCFHEKHNIAKSLLRILDKTLFWNQFFLWSEVNYY